MKFYAALLWLCAAIASATAGGGYGGSSGGSSYGGAAASIPAPPCAKNYLFSCQPSLQPAPCAQPAPSHGSAGAYSENVPRYVAAPYNGFQGLQGLQGLHALQRYFGLQYPH